MKAVIYNEYGSPDVLQLTNIEKPTPKANEILVRIHARTVNYGDLLARNFSNISHREFNMPFIFWLPTRFEFGIKKPKITILGSEYAGEVEALGDEVTKFKVGDNIFGFLSMNMGANAEYITVSQDAAVTTMPNNMTYEEAATVPYGVLTAFNLLKTLDIQQGQKILINGASGGIGSAAVQIAKHYYGAEVTGVASTKRLDFVKALGADHVIDYTREDFTQNGETYDYILDVLGRSSFSKVKNSLTAKGRYLLASFKMHHVWSMLMTAFSKGKKAKCVLSMESQADLINARQLVEDGVIKAIIDRTYPLEETAEAHRYMESGNRAGHVVVTLEPAT